MHFLLSAPTSFEKNSISREAKIPRRALMMPWSGIFYREWKAQAAVCNWTVDIFLLPLRKAKEKITNIYGAPPRHAHTLKYLGPHHSPVRQVWFHPFHRWRNRGSGPAQAHETGKEQSPDSRPGVSDSKPEPKCLPRIRISSWPPSPFPESWCVPGSSAHLGSEKGSVLITPQYSLVCRGELVTDL